MLTYDQDLFLSLRSIKRNTGPYWDERTLNGAPYKPFLLLSVMDGIEEGWIPRNRILLLAQLIERFEMYCKAIDSLGEWDIRLPFHHLASDNGLWFHESQDVARLGDELYRLLVTDTGREIVRSLLISTYFNALTGQTLNSLRSEIGVTNEMIHQLMNTVDKPFVLNHLNDPGTQTVTRKIRDDAFRIVVRRSYDFTCAVCRSRLITPSGHILVEGAHIVPHSTSHNDDPRNGMALCKTHHWLFDRYMITVNPDLRIQTSPFLREQGTHVIGTHEFDGHEIHLPRDRSVRPAAAALLDHQLRFKAANFLT